MKTVPLNANSPSLRKKYSLFNELAVRQSVHSFRSMNKGAKGEINKKEVIDIIYKVEEFMTNLKLKS